jgi:hypothetical protein
MLSNQHFKPEKKHNKLEGNLCEAYMKGALECVS